MSKVAIITGASRGIGAATAKRLAEDGYKVCVNYHANKAKADQVAAEINLAGGTAVTFKADMSQENDIISLFNHVDKTLGSVNLLVNNAGTNGGNCKVEDITLDLLHNVFATNVFGTFIACREAVKRMKFNGGGNIINISSEAAKFGGNQIAHYAASKAAINTFTIGFAREVAKYNIRVNTVSPGVIDTEMHHDATEERLTALQNSLPMKRMGKASEVAELVFWLQSALSSYVSGAVIPITGSR